MSANVRDRVRLYIAPQEEHHRTPRLVRIARRKRCAVQRDAPRVRLVRAAEDFHQRALPRAILADERMHLAHAHAQRNAPQRGSRGERFLAPSRVRRCGIGLLSVKAKGSLRTVSVAALARARAQRGDSSHPIGVS